MKLKSLTLIGFKSFKFRTTLEFRAGVTAVIGPNGCGKSNIVDAIFWVLGDQSAKHLRTQNMAEVIFAGSESQPSAGYAEVTLVMEGEGLVIPKDFVQEGQSEVVVTRRLYQDGTSEYLLNHHRCRLKDVLGIFLDSGLVGSSYAIIEQGVIGRLLESKPEDRSLLIQEVAGLTKYKVKKDEAARKMEHTRAHLARIEDLILELQKQKEALETQVVSARKHKELTESLESMQRVSRAVEAHLIGQSVAQIEGDLQSLDGEMAQTLTQSNHVQTALAKSLEVLREKEKELKHHQTGLDETRSILESARIEANSLFHGQEKTRLVIQQLKQDQERIEIQLRDLEAQSSQKLGDAQQVKADTQAFLDKHGELAREHQKLSSQHQELMERLSQERNTLRTLHQDRDAEALRHQTVSTQLETLMGQMKFKFSQQTEQQDKLQSLRSTVNLQSSEVRDAQERLDRTRRGSEVLEGQLGELQTEANRLTERYHQAHLHLQTLETQRETIRQWLTAQSLPAKAVAMPEALQPLLDHVELPAGKAEIAKSFLSHIQTHWVTSDGAGFARFVSSLPPERNRGLMVAFASESTAAPPADHEIHGILGAERAERVWDALTPRPSVPGILSKPLFKVASVQNLLQILETAAPPLPANFMSEEGAFLYDDGWLCVPSTVAESYQFFRQREEEKRLASEVALARVSVNDVQTRLEGLKTKIGKTTSDLETEQEKMQELEKEHQQRVTKLNTLELELSHFNHLWFQNSQEQDQDFETLRNLRRTFTERLECRQVLEERCQTQQNILAHLEAEEGALRESRVRLNTSYDHYEQAKSDKQRYLLTLQSECERLTVKMLELRSERDLSHLNQTQYQEELVQAELDLRQTEERVKRLENDLQGSQAKLEQTSDAFQRELDQKERLQGELRQLEQQEFAIKEKRTQWVTQLQSFREKLQGIAAEDLEGHGPSVGFSLPEELRDEETQRKHLLKLQREMAMIKKSLESLGDVNLLAIQQFEEASDRLQFLTLQRDDLLDSLANLEKTMDEIQKSVKETFLQSFMTVNRHFKRYFPILFKGGEGHLVLSEEHAVDGLPGIEIHAAPPGKKMKRNTLLSGGEKALVALALIVSLFESRPSPFLVLDEVDSPFDEANVDAFIALARQLSLRSQVLMITHNKKTMQAADFLYGVTLKEKGVSQVISVKMAAPHPMPESLSPSAPF
jgi:chromosome segregation protein